MNLYWHPGDISIENCTTCGGTGIDPIAGVCPDCNGTSN